MRSEIPTLIVLGVPIATLTREEALAEIAALHESGGPAIVAFANAHALNIASDDRVYERLIRSFDLLLNDGSGLALAARLHGDRFAANLNGTDLLPLVLDLAAARGWSVYLLGGRALVAETAAARLTERHAGLRIVGAREGFFDPADVDEVTATIEASGADLLLVAMGNPVQEWWLHDHLAATGAKIGFGVGAFLDFSAGEVRRAPPWMNRMGIEWLYRLSLEPGRLWRRYVVGNPKFLARISKEYVVVAYKRRRGILEGPAPGERRARKRRSSS